MVVGDPLLRCTVYISTAFMVSFSVFAKANGSCLGPGVSKDRDSLLLLLLTLTVNIPAVASFWRAVRTAAIVWEFLAFAILVGHNGPTIDIG